MTSQNQAAEQPGIMPERVASFAIVLPTRAKRENPASTQEADFDAFADHIAHQLAAVFGATLKSDGAGETDRTDTVDAVTDRAVRRESNFAFDLSDMVRLAETSETGVITGRAEHTNAANSYIVRYRDGNGCQTEQWWAEDALRAT